MNGIAAAVVLFAAATLATPSGIGGGLLFVPILHLVYVLDPKEAAALSQALIAGASAASLGYSLVEHFSTGEPLVVRKFIYLFLPAIIAGSTLGVLVARILPAFLQLVLLVAICWSASAVILRRANRTWEKENEAREFPCLSTTAPHFPQRNRYADFRLTSYVVLLTGIDILFVLVRGSATAESILDIPFCSPGYWAVYALQFGLFAIVAVGLAAYSQRYLGLVLAVLVTGMLGTISGIGGGIVLNPVMLEQGISPRLASATAIVIITVMSITATIDYTISGLIEPKWLHLAFAVDTFLGSLLGMVLVSVLVRKTKRQSILVFSLGVLVAFGGLLALGLGVRAFVAAIQQGDNPLKFKSPC